MTSVRCTGIVIQVGPPGTRPDRAFDLAVEVVERNLAGEWAVEPLSAVTRDFVVTRWSGRPIATGRGWDIAGKLAADRDIVSAEPAFRTRGLEPDPSDPELAPQEVYLRPESGAAEGDLRRATGLEK